MSKTQKRNDVIDIAKGISIFLVVFGHLCQGGNYVDAYFYAMIYSFHMPLFFFVSGYLYKERNIKETIKLVVQKFLIPTYMFLTADIFLSFVFENTVNTSNLPLYIINTLFVTDGIKGGSAVMNAPLWFLMAMSVILVVKSFTNKFRNFKYTLYVIIVGVLVIKQFVIKDKTLGLCWYINWYFCYVFFEFGCYMKKRNINFNTITLNKNKLFCVFVAELLILLFIPVINGISVIASFQFGKIIPLTILAGITGTDFVFIISKYITKKTNHLKKIIGYAGKHSFLIMVAHYHLSVRTPRINTFYNFLIAVALVTAELSLVYIYNHIKNKKFSNRRLYEERIRT